MRLHLLAPLVLAAVLGGFIVAPPPAGAQMPDLRTMNGRPLPVPDLPTGTVTVRVARQTPANAGAGLDVTATVTDSAGQSRNQTVKSGGDGRAQFEGLKIGSQFQAAVTVDGEKLQTERFPVPDRGGIRVMLISGLGGGGHTPQAEPGGVAPPRGDDPHAGARRPFRMGAPTGTVEPAADLPKGTLVMELKGPDSRPLPGKPVRLGEIRLTADGADKEVQVHDAVADASGTVRWEKLPTGEAAGYAAVIEHEGYRLSTHPFRMIEESGMRGRILALARTADPSVLSLDPRATKIVIDLREEAIAVMIGLSFRNQSQKIFDPGEAGLTIPLPADSVGAQEIEGGEPLEVVPGQRVSIKTAIPPDAAANFVTQARFGYILPTGGASTLALRQLFPVGWPDPFLIVPTKTGLGLEAPGLKPLQTDVDGTGDQVRSYTMSPVSAGSVLNLTVTGIPARERTGRTVAAVLCLLLIGAALLFARPTRRGRQGQANAASDRDTLISRREELFAELVSIEEQRKGSTQAAARLAERRKELIAKLEVVYRDLARLEEHP